MTTDSRHDSQHIRMVEALLFAAAEPLDEASLHARLPDDVDLAAALDGVTARYADSGVNVVRVAGRWAFRTAPDLKFLLEKEVEVSRKLSRAAVETLAIIAYHQPITRAEIEEVRGVAISKGTIDVLMEEDWVRPKGRRKTPGRPVTYGTTGNFLEHFGLEELADLPGIEELKAAGLLSARPPASLVAEAREHAAVTAKPEEESDEERFSEWDDQEDASSSEEDTENDDLEGDEKKTPSNEVETEDEEDIEGDEEE
ncbi:MAG: SMC-Scp complex subunit ScpB [Alphaproteobacteria bacterium]|jgi:segregation and condensation protein B|nr:SMC-Scp complex subunit ScpB [Alphaproteobacteria bacterium]MBT4018229.1 SMC-Scp complex subunit ScpB [Alphaproteobacteria bacterium]MBT4966340.1 SMC-Scp complex subunit ScpB [Alphaproteobacteria bacterium]MBT5160778.1 SMC-Scp complex subunit ScpB [Alphaproteobacteria bacterium]MBT6384387.1 SMC-Scp complex subunit ScpB [Alphaproteobacteria bacterium]